MSFFQSSGIVGIPLALVLILLLIQLARVVSARVRRGADGVVASQLGAILVLGVVGACLGVLGTLVGVWVSAGAITVAGEVSAALVWSMIRVALTPAIMGFFILGVASVAWLVLHYWSTRGAGALVVVLVLLAGASCDRDPDSDSGAALTRDSAGVAIVENRATDRPFAGQVVQLAELMTPDDALAPLPWGIAADAGTGRVYVADRGGNRVAIFDASGTYVGQLGRQGDGPGEFRLPSALTLGPGGTVVALDGRRGLLSRWSSDGEFLREEPIPGSYWGPGFAVGPDWFASVTETTTGMRIDQRLQIQSAGNVRTVHEVAREIVMMELPCVTMPAPRVFAPDVVWTSQGDTFYYLHGPDYRIDVHTGGDLVTSFRRSVAPLAVSRAMAVQGVEFGPGPYQTLLRQCGISAEELVNEVSHEDRLAPVVGLAVDPRGRVWVARRNAGLAPEVIDIMDAQGQYLGTVELAVLPVAFLSESRFVGMRVLMATGQLQLSLYEVLEEGHTRGDGAARKANGTPTREETPTRPGTSRGDVTAERAAAGTARAAGEAAQVPNPAGLKEFRDCPACPLMIQLPPGRYLMGRPDGEEERLGMNRNPDRVQFSRDAERPNLEVEIAYPIALGKYEITFDEWDHCVDSGGCAYRPTDRGWGRGNRPVIHVSRLDAEEYIAWLQEVTGEAYRLPSSAEWEYAARAGTATARWWGDELGTGMAVCDGCGSRWDDVSTVPVGSFSANPWGLHDMLSNVSEVVADCWHDSYEGHPTDGSPRLKPPPGWPDDQCRRATWRGGAWPSFTWAVRAATRGGGNMVLDYRDDHPMAGGGHGFRVARTVVRSPGQPL